MSGITRRHLPGIRLHHDPVRTFIFCELRPESPGDFIVPLFGQFSCFTVHFTGWPNCKLKSDGIVQIFADEYLSIDLLKCDVLVARDLSCFVTTPVSAIEKGPRPMSAHFPRCGSSETGFLADPSHGLSLIPRQTIIVMIPPGLRLLRILRSPATGLSKNCVPNLEKQKS